MIQDLFDDDGVLDTRDHFDGAVALATGFDIDCEYAFEALGPSHATSRWARIWSSLGAGLPRLAGVTCERCLLLGAHAVEPCQVHPRFRYQSGQTGDKIQRFENDMGT